MRKAAKAESLWTCFCISLLTQLCVCVCCMHVIHIFTPFPILRLWRALAHTFHSSLLNNPSTPESMQQASWGLSSLGIGCYAMWSFWVSRSRHNTYNPVTTARAGASLADNQVSGHTRVAHSQEIYFKVLMYPIWWFCDLMSADNNTSVLWCCLWSPGTKLLGLIPCSSKMEKKLKSILWGSKPVPCGRTCSCSPAAYC